MNGLAVAAGRCAFALLLASSLLAHPPVYAVDAAKPRLAFVIANADYANIGRLRNPAADGELVASALKAAGFEVTFLRNVSDTSMRAAMRQIARESTKSDVTLVYYAGHGVQIGGVNYLLPVDLPAPEGEDDIRLASLSADDVLSVIKSPYKILVLDACRDNPVLGRALAKGRGASYKRGLAPVAPPAEAAGGVFIAYSTQSDAVAMDGEGANSPFAESFAKYVGNRLSIDDMFAMVTKDVLKKTNGEQRPFKYASLDAVFCLPGECSAAAEPGAAQPAMLATEAPAPPPPMSAAALQTTFKQLNTTKSASARQKIEQQLWEYLRAALPRRVTYGVTKAVEGQTQSAFAFNPQTAVSDGHRAAVTREWGVLRDGVPVFDGAQYDDLVINCDMGEYVTTRTQYKNRSVKLFSKAEQTEKKTKVVAGSIFESLQSVLCRAPLRLTPIWAVNSLEWTPLGQEHSVAASVVYSDPRDPQVRYAFVRDMLPKPDIYGAIADYGWLGLNCRAKTAQGLTFFAMSPGGAFNYVWGTPPAWGTYTPLSVDANVYVLLCDQ
jgi:hypothetical protein